MKLAALLSALSGAYQLEGQADVSVSALCLDSRQVQAGSLFVAIKGQQRDGHDYLAQVAAQGASVIVCEQLPPRLETACTYVQVPDSAQAAGLLASAFYGYPSQQMAIVGVTGTNGKTSIATLLYRLYSAMGETCGLISTVDYRIKDRVYPSTHTTPNALRLQALLAEMREAGCTKVFMEVSSHAADQKRIAGLQFRGAIFSNLSHDHLDYHGTFAAYIQAKKSFFDHLPPSAFALINVDDKRGRVMVQNTKAKVYTYSLSSLADFRCRLSENNLTGLVLDFEGQTVHSRLVGRFNAYNFLAVYGAACLLGQEPHEVLRILSGLSSAEGRFEAHFEAQLGILGIVDYAHTPDALEQVLQTLGQMPEAQQGRIITVVGCGGDRDKTKRPLMARAACLLSQQVILSSDNPRTEDPLAILADMQAGVPSGALGYTLLIPDRRQAIRTACQLAQRGDIILIAGKGHEKYQEIQGTKHPFDDKQELQAALSEKLKTLAKS